MKSFNFFLFQKNMLLALPIRRFSLRMLAVLLFFAGAKFSPLHGQETIWKQVGEDMPSEGYASGTMSADGSTVAVGAPSARQVQVFKKINGGWVQQGADIEDADAYGFGSLLSLSADGKVLAVATRYGSGGGTYRGEVRVFQWVGGDWVQMGGDLNGTQNYQYFGRSVSLSADGLSLGVTSEYKVQAFKWLGGNWMQTGVFDATLTYGEKFAVKMSPDGLTMAFSEPYFGSSYEGGVRVFRFLDGVWTQLGEPIAGELSEEFFGGSLSFSSNGNTLAVGSSNFYHDYGDWGTYYPGRAAVFQYVSGSWVQVGANIVGRVFTNSGLGKSVSLSSDGSTLAVGAPHFSPCSDMLGEVLIYKNIGGSWVKQYSRMRASANDQALGYEVSLAADGTSLSAYANSGYVRVYENVPTDWLPQGSAINGETDSDFSGSALSVSADGSVVAISTPLNDAAGTNAGHTRVFQKINGAWTQQGADIDGEVAYDKSGTSVAVSADGQRVAIGAPLNYEGGFWAGQVRVFEKINNAWTQLGADIQGNPAAGGNWDINFGESISLSADGSVVAVGAPKYTRNSPDWAPETGQVKVFKYISGSWQQQGATIEGVSSQERVGYSVSISADGLTLAVSKLGGARVYQFIGGNWVQQGSISGGASFDQYIQQVSLSSDGSTVAVVAPYFQINGQTPGQIRVFKNISDSWTQQGAAITGADPFGQIGRSLSLSSNGTRLGFFSTNYECIQSSVAKIFQFSNGAWSQLGIPLDDELAQIKSLSLSSDGTTVAVGVPEASGGGDLRGHVRVFKINSCTPPTVFSVTGGGQFLTQAVPIGLAGSQIGAEYQLWRDANFPVGSPVAGTGGALDFPPQTVRGTYTVLAKWTAQPDCWAKMSGSAAILLETVAPTIDDCPENVTLNNLEDCRAVFSVPFPSVFDAENLVFWNAEFSGNPKGNPPAFFYYPAMTNSAPLSFQTGTTTVTLSAVDAADNLSTQNCSFTVTVNQPKFQLLGGSPLQVIENESFPPIESNHTDFGNLPSRIFTIKNTGTFPLEVSQILNYQPSFFKIAGGTGSIPPNGTKTFTVTFTPDEFQEKETTIRILTSDCDAPEFRFGIKARLTAARLDCPLPVVVDATPGTCTATNVALSTPTAWSETPNNALNFHPTNDRVELSNLTFQNAFTIEAWVKPNYFNYGYLTIFHNKEVPYGSNYNGPGMLFAINDFTSGGNAYLTLITQGVSATSPVKIATNKWQHLAVTYDGSEVKFFINGIETGLTDNSQVNFSGANFTSYLGGNSEGYFNGNMDEVRVWNIARTPAEISSNLHTTLSGTTPGLLAYYLLQQGVAGGNNSGVTSITDLAPSAGGVNNGTLQNFSLSGNVSNWVSGRVKSLNLTFTNDAPTSFSYGNSTVTWSATYPNGTTRTCQQTVTVNDVQAPAPDVASLPNFNGGCQATPTPPTATDLFTGAVTATTTTVFPITELGTTVVTWTFTDASGNSTTQTQNIVVNCDQDNDGFNGDIDCNDLDETIHPNATEICNSVDDDCDGFADGADSDLPDDTPPTISNCPENQNLTVAAGTCAAIFAIPAPTITDNCSATMTWNASFSGNANSNPTNLTNLASTAPSGNVAFSKGTTSVLLTAVDAKGNFSTQNCAFEIAVVDNVLPQIICPQNVSGSTAAGTCSGTATWTPPVGTDNCSGATTVGSHSPGDSFGKGTTVVTYTTTDASANLKTCSFNVVVSDTELPSIACPQNISLNIAPSTCANTATWTAPVGTGNCPETVTTSTHAPGNSFAKGSTTVVYQATDASGNAKTCSFSVVVSDNEKPVIACPQNVSLSTAAGTCSGIAMWTAPVGTDNCSGATTTGSHSSGSSFPKGTTLVTYTATDASANSETCTFNVVVSDNEKPAIACPQNVSVNVVAGACSNTATWIPPVGTDNCPGATTNGSHSPGDTFSAGTTTVIYTTTDASENAETCSFNVVVSDNEPPVVACPANQNIAAGTGCASQLGTFSLLSKMDNCTASAEISTSQSPASTTILSGIDDSETVSLTATDGHGNSATCSFTVTLKDLTGPAVPVLEAINAICTATPPVPTALDNCAGTITATTTTEFPITALGTTTVTWVFNDGNGNTTTATQNVVVVCDQDDDGHYPPNDCNDLDNTIYPGAPEICDFKDNDCDLATDEGLIHIELGIGATTATCATADNASINLTVVAGAPPLSFAWASGQTSEDLTQLFSGNYVVTVSGSDGCTATAAAEVQIFNNMDLGMVKIQPTCFGNTNGAIFSAPSGGTAPYTFAWSNSKTTQNVNLLGAGAYTLTLTDADACTYTESTTLTSPPALTMSVTATPTSATIAAGGGTPGYLYNRTGALPFQPSPVFTGLTPGASYIFKTQDANGCQKNVIKKLPTSMAPAGGGMALQPVFDRFEDENSSEDQFVIFPNPTDNILNISFLNEETSVRQVEIFNQIGQKVFTQNLSIEPGEDGVLQVAHLPQGSYFLSFRNENGSTACARFLKN